MGSDPSRFMSRRRSLTLMGGAAVALAGCAGSDGGDGDDGETETATRTPTEAEPETATRTPTEAASPTSTATPGAEADVSIDVGPDGSLRFEPESVGISAGDTVEWVFRSGGHNVSARPEDSSEVSIPEGAEPFASYSDDEFETDPSGTTYTHTIETTGEFVYVCVPHVSAGMIGTLQVR